MGASAFASRDSRVRFGILASGKRRVWRLPLLFSGKVDLSDVNEGDKTNHLLTRGLAAYAVQYLADAEPDDAAKAITDGFDDNGLDAVYYDPRERRLYLIQSKWFHDGTGEPSNGDVKKFVAGVRDLFNLNFDRFNAKVADKRDLIVKAMNDPVTRYEAVIVLSECKQALEALPDRSRRSGYGDERPY